MKILRRILVATVVTLAVLFVGVTWVAPIAISFYAAEKAPQVTRVVPKPLPDTSVSQAPGTKLAYFGYEFEVPWTDLNDTLTKLYPTDKPEKNMADLRFRSGLRLMVSAIPPRYWARNFAHEMKVSPEAMETAFGRDIIQSDYTFYKTLYEFTPEKMNHWSAAQRGVSRDEMLLTIKSLALTKSATSGIFVVQNGDYRGFQEGHPAGKPSALLFHLFGNDGSIEMVFFQSDYANASGVTQPEINRIIESVRRVSEENEQTRQHEGVR